MSFFVTLFFFVVPLVDEVHEMVIVQHGCCATGFIYIQGAFVDGLIFGFIFANKFFL